MRVKQLEHQLNNTIKAFKNCDGESFLDIGVIDEIFSVSEALVSEGLKIYEEKSLPIDANEWILDAFALAGLDKKFNFAFVDFARTYCKDFNKLYAISCKFFYRKLRRGENEDTSIDAFRTMLISIVSPDAVEKILFKLRKNSII
jgi:hypothetical protein